MEVDRIYPAKILLLGEYVAMAGLESVAVPWYQYSGHWTRDKKDTTNKKSLKDYKRFFKNKEPQYLYLEAWKEDLKNGITFESDIPFGYGIGSSGALVAGVFERYALDTELNLEELKQVFIEMESYFHGTSSGIDPLVSYLERGIIIKGGNVQIFDYEDIKILDHIYLWDTEISRQTKPLITWYQKQLHNQEFQHIINEELLIANSKALEALISDNMADWCTSFQDISRIQRRHFTPMIPQNIEEDWDIIANMDGASIKICGAGGGGFYLVLAENKKIVQKLNKIVKGKISPFKSILSTL